MVVNGGSQRWPTTVNGGGPPSDHRSTTSQRWLTASQQPSLAGNGPGHDRVLGRVWIRSGLGPPRGATCQLTWRIGDITGKGPTWLFDLDYLTDSMNYHPVRSENQANLHMRSTIIYYTPSNLCREGPREEEQVFLDELERLKRQEKEANEEAELLRKEVWHREAEKGGCWVQGTQEDFRSSEDDSWLMLNAKKNFDGALGKGIAPRKSTIEVVNFLGRKTIILAMQKGQTHCGYFYYRSQNMLLALQANCGSCGFNNQMLDYGFNFMIQRSTIVMKATNFHSQHGRDLEKSEGNAEFYEIIDFLKASFHSHAPHCSPVVSTKHLLKTDFGHKQLANVSVPLDHFPVNTLTSKVFSFMVKKGKHFSGKVTPLFATMLVQPTQDEGAPSERPSEAQPTPSPAPTSEVPNEPQTDSSPAQTREGNEGDMTLQSVYDLCLSLCAQVSDQAKEIQHLKAQITKLKKQAKPVIKHHRAWLKSVSLKQRLTRKSFSKKQRVHKESVSKQGRKFAKGESSVQRDPLFDEIPEDTVDHMETENAQICGEDKRNVSTDKEKVSTDRPIVSTDGSKVSTDRQIEGTDEQNEGTEEQIKSTDGQRKGTEDHTEEGSATQVTQTPTSTIFGDDETNTKGSSQHESSQSIIKLRQM
ncbi:hypothetical protein Tco_1517074 [Tanacetum coccineum]